MHSKWSSDWNNNYNNNIVHHSCAHVYVRTIARILWQKERAKTKRENSEKGEAKRKMLQKSLELILMRA